MSHRIKLVNEFHGTSTTVMSDATTGDDAYTAIWFVATYGKPEFAKPARRVLARVKKALCGQDDCRCGSIWGEENSVDQVGR